MTRRSRRPTIDLRQLTAEFTGAASRKCWQVEGDYQTKVATIEGDYSRQSTELLNRTERGRAETEAWHVEAFQKLADEWHTGTARVRADLEDICVPEQSAVSGLGLARHGGGWPPPNGVPAGVRFGRVGRGRGGASRRSAEPIRS